MKKHPTPRQHQSDNDLFTKRARRLADVSSQRHPFFSNLSGERSWEAIHFQRHFISPSVENFWFEVKSTTTSTNACIFVSTLGDAMGKRRLKPSRPVADADALSAVLVPVGVAHSADAPGLFAVKQLIARGLWCLNGELGACLFGGWWMFQYCICYCRCFYLITSPVEIAFYARKITNSNSPLANFFWKKPSRTCGKDLLKHQPTNLSLPWIW